MLKMGHASGRPDASDQLMGNGTERTKPPLTMSAGLLLFLPARVALLF